MEMWDHQLGFAGKRCIEIGGALPPELVIDVYKAREWKAVDDRSAYVAEVYGGDATPKAPPVRRVYHSLATWNVADQRIEDLQGNFDGCFDVAVSLAAFEHIADLLSALRSIRRLLRPGGNFMVLVGPIWSGYRGHHVLPTYFPCFPEEAGILLGLLGPWRHLLQTRTELHAALRTKVSQEFADLAVYSIYESPRLNRLFFEEYLMLFRRAGFQVMDLGPWPTPMHVDRTVLHGLRLRMPGCGRFEVDGFTAILKLTAHCEKLARSHELLRGEGRGMNVG